MCCIMYSSERLENKREAILLQKIARIGDVSSVEISTNIAMGAHRRGTTLWSVAAS